VTEGSGRYRAKVEPDNLYACFGTRSLRCQYSNNMRLDTFNTGARTLKSTSPSDRVTLLTAFIEQMPIGYTRVEASDKGKK
jgi:hypothetical protein